MKLPPTFIALPYRHCIDCAQYKRVTAGCQNSTRHQGSTPVKPFVCAECMSKRRAA